MFYTEYTSPIGQLLLVGDSHSVHKIVFPQERRSAAPESDWQPNAQAFSTLIGELDQYFNGTLQQFTVPVSPQGTEFQRTVWGALKNVEYGATCSYRDIETAIGKPLQQPLESRQPVAQSVRLTALTQYPSSSPAIG